MIHLHDLVEVLQELVAVHQRVRCLLHQLNLRRFDHDFHLALDFDLALLRIDLDLVAAALVGQDDILVGRVQHDLA
ncbi:MAG TPA: hypothetical protein VFU22_08035, partial [Roseiflexaceae bacterium]|nr:hypothetical protein [Roseiflexaceae bacterium]